MATFSTRACNNNHGHFALFLTCKRRWCVECISSRNLSFSCELVMQGVVGSRLEEKRGLNGMAKL